MNCQKKNVKTYVLQFDRKLGYQRIGYKTFSSFATKKGDLFISHLCKMQLLLKIGFCHGRC